MKKIIVALALFVPFQVQADLISQDLGASAYTASATWESFTPDLAFDGDIATNWNAGDWTSPRGSQQQWIEVNLGQSYDISNFELVVAQSPDGIVEHEIWLSSSPIGTDTTGAKHVAKIDGFVIKQQVLMAALSAPVSAQFVQIRTTISPSWIAWNEIRVFGSVSEVPTPAAIWLFGPALIGLVGIRRRCKAA